VEELRRRRDEIDGMIEERAPALSGREAEALRDVAATDAGRSTTRRDLSLLLERGLRTKTTVALSRAEARELADLLATGAFGSNLALLQDGASRVFQPSPCGVRRAPCGSLRGPPADERGMLRCLSGKRTGSARDAVVVLVAAAGSQLVRV